MVLIDGGFIARGPSPVANVLKVVRSSARGQLGSRDTIAITDGHGGLLGIHQSFFDDCCRSLVSLLDLWVEKSMLGSLHSSLGLHLVLWKQILQTLGGVQNLLTKSSELILAADSSDGVESPGPLDFLSKLTLVKSLLITLVLTMLLHLQPSGVLLDSVLGPSLEATVELCLADIRSRMIIVPVLPRVVILGHCIVVKKFSLLVARLGRCAVHHLLSGHRNFYIRPTSQNAALLGGRIRRAGSSRRCAVTLGSFRAIAASVILRLDPIFLGCSKGNTGL
mmetsp:Transcript_1803/g.4049  ORF Transcript_1803/g.4049 Transcript_1803/m.4049 type:complete len:279 (+) Transcript_1803:134-970(+)